MRHSNSYKEKRARRIINTTCEPFTFATRRFIRRKHIKHFIPKNGFAFFICVMKSNHRPFYCGAINHGCGSRDATSGDYRSIILLIRMNDIKLKYGGTYILKMGSVKHEIDHIVDIYNLDN